MVKKIAYKVRFIDSLRFMSASLSELVDYMSEIFNSIECKSCMANNRCEQCKKLIEGLIEKFPSVHQFCNGNLSKFVLLLRKDVYPYEYMDNWRCLKMSLKTLEICLLIYMNLILYILCLHPD